MEFLAALIGGWLGDYLLRRMKSAYYLVSRPQDGAGSSIHGGRPVLMKGPLMVPAIGIAAFFLLLNTSPSTLLSSTP